MDAWRHAGRRTEPDLAPGPGDVLVVTQKVVSKAEGRIVDLTTVEPRPEAVAFAERWDRDARQVEVVLRESAAVLRMEQGVIICAHAPRATSAPTPAWTPPTSARTTR